MTDALPRKRDSKDGASRFVRPLPSNPSLEKQRKLAKALMRDYCRRSEQAVARVGALHPNPPAPDAFTLSDAQLVVARGYGIQSWPKLKHKIDSLTRSPADRFVDAVKSGDVDAVRSLLAAHPDLAARINDPLFDFGRTAVHAARGNLEMLDLLLAQGGDITAKSKWENGGFGILEDVAPDKAGPLIARGAVVDIWSAANLGMTDKLRALVENDPSLVNAKGGDGKRPLHFARTVAVASYLLDHGAEIDALDDDHASTPAQHLLRDRPEVTRFLLSRRARSDLLMAAALGDVDLVRRHLDRDPPAIRIRVSQDWFPMIDTAKNGGHIYQWTLGFYLSAHQIARKFGHQAVVDALNERTPTVDRLLDALWAGDLGTADAIIADDPDLVRTADGETTRHVADAARGNRTDVVRAMLARGFPVTATSQHGATPLHWAAFHGNPEMVRLVLDHDPPLETRDPDYDATPLEWALHGAFGHWPGISTAQHGTCVTLLLAAGAHCRDDAFPIGHDDVDQALRRHFFPT